jgi:DNA polymerase III delta prime subunit
MFKKAKRTQAKIKLAITGPAGSGKTYSALRLARGLVGPGGRIALIDTENGSASLYSEQFDFDVLNLKPPFEDASFIEGIQGAVNASYDALIIDSASHFWEAILEYKDKLDRRGGNSFSNWNEAGKHFKGVLNAVLHSPIHVIACLRSKTEYVVETNERGRSVPRKVGLAPVMRDGIEYEFTTVFDIDLSHQAATSKDRTGLFTDKVFQVTEETGQQIAEWLTTTGGQDAPENTASQPAPAAHTAPASPPADTGKPATGQQIKNIQALWKTLGYGQEQMAKLFQWLDTEALAGAESWDDLTMEQAARAIGFLSKKVAEGGAS